MTYPKRFLNTDREEPYVATKAADKFLKNGFQVIVKQQKVQFADPSKPAKKTPGGTWGKLTWEIDNGRLLLHTIESHPEHGSGLGSLLMYLAGCEARAANVDRVDILLPAVDVQSFYLHMGCKRDYASASPAAIASTDPKVIASVPIYAQADDLIQRAYSSASKHWHGI